MKILAIETSCDETAIAILAAHSHYRSSPREREIKFLHLGVQRLSEPVFNLLSNVVLSQIKVHQLYGGVVPNLAMREHQKNLVPILTTALRDAKMLSRRTTSVTIKKVGTPTKASVQQKTEIIKIEQKLSTILSREQILLDELQKFVKKYDVPDIDAIAVTHGPGLEPALWVGINFAKALSAVWGKPLLPINHLEGHIYAGFLPKAQGFQNFTFPSSKDIFFALALIVSGGHTELVLVKKHLNYKILGETRDDAAGEAFDKVAKMLRLGYPGGPEISKIAEEGDPYAIDFPRPMINSKDFDFSFSGLKTAVLYYLRDRANHLSFSRLNPSRVRAGSDTDSESKWFADSDIAASFEQAVIDVLVSKTAKALKKYKVKSLVVGGGVVANKKLRQSFEYMIKLFPETKLYLSPLWLTGDNAAMIAVAAYFRSLQKQKPDVAKIRANGNLKL